MIGAFVASTVVALVQYVRSRDRRLLALAGGFLLPAFALSRGWGQGWSDLFLGAVCLVGLVLVVLLPTRELATTGARGSDHDSDEHGREGAR